MKSSSVLSLLLAVPAYSKLTYSAPQCSYLVGSKKPRGRIPTVTETIVNTLSLTETVVTQPTETYTPTVTTTSMSSLCAKTVTIRHKDRPSVYITRTKTKTYDSTSSVVSTSTTYLSLTVTPPPYTTTIAPPPGYEPIQSVDNKYLPRREAADADLHVLERDAQQQTCSVDGKGKLHWYPPIYTTALLCTKTAFTAVTTTTTVQGTDTCTSTAYPPATETYVSTEQYVGTTTEYIVKGKTKTYKSWTTTTITDCKYDISTAYETVTATCTAPAPPAYTEYAICSDDNIASHYQDGDKALPVCAVAYNASSAFALADYPSAKACCNLCASSEDCAGSVYSQAQGTCVIVGDNGVCDPTVNYFQGSADDSISDDQRFFLSNGPCGRGSIAPA